VTSSLSLDEVRCRPPPSCRGSRTEGSAVLPERSPLRIVWGSRRARDALASTIDYATTAHPVRRPIAGFQLTQRKLAEAAVALNTRG